jgi:hypothetical protein
MTVGDRRLGHRIGRQVGVGAAVPEREGQDPHERAVAVGPRVGGPGRRGGHPGTQGSDGDPGLDADVEDVAVDGIPALVVPRDQSAADVVHVEVTHPQERFEQDEGLGTVVRPGAGGDPGMGPGEAGGRDHLDLVGGRDLRGWVEFVGHSERITDEKPEDPAAQAVASGHARHCPSSQHPVIPSVRSWTRQDTPPVAQEGRGGDLVVGSGALTREEHGVQSVVGEPRQLARQHPRRSQDGSGHRDLGQPRPPGPGWI